MSNAIRRLRPVAVAILALGLAACDEITVQVPTAPTAPTAPATPATGTLVEFRVTGETGGAVIRMSNGIDGLTQITSVLPYSTTVDLGTRTNVFLSLEARGVSFGFMHAAIYVNGIVFREGSASSLSPVVTINGTYRR